MKTFQELQEGVYDPNIFKAFFMAGGPGSGKSYVVKKSTGGTGLKIVNSDEAFERLLKQAGLSLKMPDNETIARDKVRDKAKALTDKRKGNYIEGRLGLIIDGTGKDYNKITKQASDLKNIGYDVHMIFVNTSLDVALARNEKRPRKLPEKLVVSSWNNVQKNIGKFSQLFQRGFIIVDNNDPNEDVMLGVFKRVKKLAKKKVTNGIAKAWIARELEMKKRV